MNIRLLLLSSVLIASSLVQAASSTQSIEECFSCPTGSFDSSKCPCIIGDPEFAFEAHLTFDQVVVGVDNEHAESRPTAERPGTGPNEVHGKFEICFNKEMSKLVYRLTVFNIDKGNRNVNERLWGATLYYSNPFTGVDPLPTVPPTFARDTLVNNIDVTSTLPLCSQAKGGPLLDGEDRFGDNDAECPYFTPVQSDCFCCTGEITNEDILTGFDGAIPILQRTNIAKIYQQLRLGKAGVVVTGSKCDPYAAGYGKADGGLIRGQIFGQKTGSHFDNSELIGRCRI